MGYFGQLGAVTSTSTSGWSLQKYDAIAEAKAKATAGNFLIITVGWEGAYTRVTSYPTYALAAAAWDATYQMPKQLPDDMAYALLYNKTEKEGWHGVENNFNLLRTSTTKKTDWRNQIPWIVSGVVVVAAAVYLTRTMKRGVARRGRRKLRTLARARRSR